MKKLSFLALAAVGLLFGACASNDADEKAGGEIAEHGQGYFKVGINLPSVPMTRADWNEEGTESKLHDGKDSEWAVENTVLLIFAGANEASATLAQVNTIAGDYDKYDTDDPNQVTSRKEHVIELTADRSSNLYALAVVNGAGIIEQGSGNSVKINGGSDVSGITIADLQSALATAAPTGMADLAGNFVNASKHIFMTNAVLSDVQGGKVIPTGAKTFVLAPIDKSKVYVDKAGALSGVAAADIYVERGVAKVTISGTTLTVDGIDVAGSSSAPTATFGGWCLDNTNKSSYLVRNVPAAQDWTLVNKALEASTSTDKYRFVGQSSVDGAGAVGYRTYWAQDPNYDIAYDAANFYSPAAADKVFVTATGDDNPLYCFENTFTVANQSVKNTTRAVVKVNLNGTNDFFTIDGDRKTLYPESELEKLVVSNLFTDGAFITWYGTNGKPEADANNLKKVYTDIVIAFNYGSKTAGSAGLISVDKITIPGKALAGGSDVTLADGSDPGLTNIITRINSKLKSIRYYKGGVAYYTIRIQHFGNDLTPWNTTEYTTAPAENTIALIYPGTADVQNKNYLGRYGMVRNNWYELTLGDVLKIGSPVIPGIDAKSDPDEPTDPDNPDDPDHPDDSIDELYIKARINVLSWAKRPQNWNLK